MRWKGTCAYDGTDFCGWQSQISRNGVQDVLERQLKEIFKRNVRIHGSGRTDAGVHAERQVFHFDADWRYGSDKLLKAFSSGLRQDLQIITLDQADNNFHARYSAKRKRYRYEIYPGTPSPFETRYCWGLKPSKSLDCKLIERCCSLFLGEHNFSAFAGRVLPDENPIKTLYRCDLKLEGPRLKFWTEGSGFLYRMVRMIIGALIDAGYGRLNADILKAMIDSGKALSKITPAPAVGLFLEEVSY